MLNTKSLFAILATISMLAPQASGLPTTSDTSPRAIDIFERSDIHARDNCLAIESESKFCTITITDSRRANAKQLVYVLDQTCKIIGHAYSKSTFDIITPSLAHHVTGDITVMPTGDNLTPHPSFCYGSACRGSTDACWRVDMTNDMLTHICIFGC